jgi:hypothetical protein
MKKYLLGIFAVLIALGLSSFTAPKKHSAAKSTDLYWYAVTFEDSQPQIEVQSPLAHISYEEAYFTEINCEGSQIMCNAGFETALNFSGGKVTGFTQDRKFDKDVQ